MHFWKYCGAGNDFVILENFDGSIAPERYAALAAALCREHFSVGADGLMVLEPPAHIFYRRLSVSLSCYPFLCGSVWRVYFMRSPVMILGSVILTLP